MLREPVRELLAPLIISQNTPGAVSAGVGGGPELGYVLWLLFGRKKKVKRKPSLDLLKFLQVIRSLRALGAFSRMNIPIEVDF
jgi:hypothetical protein